MGYGGSFSSLATVDPIVDLRILSSALKDESSRDQLVKRFFDRSGLALDIQLRQPPFGNSCQRVLGVRMHEQVVEDCPRNAGSPEFRHCSRRDSAEIDSAISAPLTTSLIFGINAGTRKIDEVVFDQVSLQEEEKGFTSNKCNQAKLALAKTRNSMVLSSPWI